MSRRRRKLDKVERRNDEKRQKRRRSNLRTKWIIICLGGLLGLIALTAVGSYFWFRSYLGSEELRELAEQQLGGRFDAKVKLSEQTWNGSEVRVDDLTLRGNGKLEAIDVSGLDATFDFDQLWSRRVQVDALNLNQLKLTFDQRSDSTGDAAAVAPAPQGAAKPSTSEPPSNPGFFSRFAPKEFKIDEIKVGRAKLLVRSDLGDYVLDQTRATISPFPGQDEARRITLGGGRLKLPTGPFPELDLVNASMRVSPGVVFISQAAFRYGDRGTLDLSGEWDRVAGNWNIEGSGDVIDTDELLPAVWHDSVAGTVRFNVSANHKKGDDTDWKGDVEISKGVLQNLGFLDTLAAYTGKTQFRSPSFEEANFRFQQKGDQLRLHHLNFYSRNLARVEGEIRIQDGLIDGQLMVGIPPGTLSFIPGAETKVFLATNNQGRFGWLWAPVRITGKDGTWTEDLTRRLMDAAGERLFELVPETGEKVLKFTQKSAREILRDPVKGGLDTIRDGSKLLEDTVGGGLGSGLGIIGGGIFPPSPPEPSPDEKDKDSSPQE